MLDPIKPLTPVMSTVEPLGTTNCSIGRDMVFTGRRAESESSADEGDASVRSRRERI